DGTQERAKLCVAKEVAQLDLCGGAVLVLRAEAQRVAPRAGQRNALRSASPQRRQRPVDEIVCVLRQHAALVSRAIGDSGVRHVQHDAADAAVGRGSEILTTLDNAEASAVHERAVALAAGALELAVDLLPCSIAEGACESTDCDGAPNFERDLQVA